MFDYFEFIMVGVVVILGIILVIPKIKHFMRWRQSGKILSRSHNKSLINNSEMTQLFMPVEYSAKYGLYVRKLDTGNGLAKYVIDSGSQICVAPSSFTSLGSRNVTSLCAIGKVSGVPTSHLIRVTSTGDPKRDRIDAITSATWDPTRTDDLGVIGIGGYRNVPGCMLYHFEARCVTLMLMPGGMVIIATVEAMWYRGTQPVLNDVIQHHSNTRSTITLFANLSRDSPSFYVDQIDFILDGKTCNTVFNGSVMINTGISATSILNGDDEPSLVFDEIRLTHQSRVTRFFSSDCECIPRMTDGAVLAIGAKTLSRCNDMRIVFDYGNSQITIIKDPPMYLNPASKYS